MSDALKNTEEMINETSVVASGAPGKSTDPDPTCCRAPGDPDGGPDT